MSNSLSIKDIAERLRFAYTEDDLDEAADEIDHLRTEIERLRMAYEQERQDCINLTEKVIPNLRDEIERLQADVVHWREARRMCLSAGDMMKAEIERLRGLLREGLGEHVRLHVHPHFPAWEKRVREALGE